MKKGKSLKVAIVMGSDSDWATMQEAAQALDDFGIEYDARVVSAHRTPVEMVEFAESARKKGYGVIIAGAGGAAHLPGMVAALTEVAVIGVPVPLVRQGSLNGMDSLLSIVQMPKGVPVATVAIGGAFNAGILAAQILGVSDPNILDRVQKYKQSLRLAVLQKKIQSPSKKKR